MRALAYVLAGALAAALALTVARAAAPAPVPQLHSVWCARDGYPARLAWPVVTGPGTGLTGCPPGEHQVSPGR